MPVPSTLRTQYHPVHLGHSTAQFLALPQRVAGNRGIYEAHRAVNYDPATGLLTSGQAFLYAAVDVNSGRRVALKQLLDPANPDARERHERECAFVLSGRTHPHIVTGLERFQDGREEFLVMEWVEGNTLGHEAMQHGPFPTDDIVEHLMTLARVLHFVNISGFLFRDLNEGNVMVTPSGKLVVLDFGGIQPVNALRPTRLLPPSVAPEVATAVAAGRLPVFTPQSEVYACATLGYLMATGRLVPDDRKSQPLSPPRALNPSLDPAVEALLMQALEENPACRPATPLALVRLLEALSSGFQKPAPPAAPPVCPIPPGIVPPSVGVPPAVAVPPPALAAPPPSVVPAAASAPSASWATVALALQSVGQECAAWVRYSRQQVRHALQARTVDVWRILAACLAVATAVLTLFCFQPRRLSMPSSLPPERAAASGNLASPPPTVPDADTPRMSAPETAIALPLPAPERPQRVAVPSLSPPLVMVAGSRVNLRTRPRLSCAVQGVVSAPKRLRLLGRWNGWYKVAASDGTQGFVWGAFLPVEPTYRRGILRRSWPLGGVGTEAGEKLLLLSVTPATDRVLLPTGKVVTVPAGVVNVLTAGLLHAVVPPLSSPDIL